MFSGIFVIAGVHRLITSRIYEGDGISLMVLVVLPILLFSSSHSLPVDRSTLAIQTFDSLERLEGAG